MSEERKAKAAARRAARREKKFSSGDANEQYGGELEASKITANNEGASNPLVGKAEVMNPNGVIPVEQSWENHSINNVTPITRGAVANNPKGIIEVQPSSENHSLSNVSPIQQRQAEIMNPKGIIEVEPSNNNLRNVSPIVGKAEVANPKGLANPTSTQTNSATTMSGPKPEININTTIAKPAPLEDMSKYGGELEASKSIGEDKRGVKPITSNAVVANPKGIIPVKPSKNKNIYNLDPIVGKAEVMNPKGIIPVEPSPNNDLRNVPSITGQAEVMNPAGLAKPTVETEKPLTIEDMLSAQRKRLEQDKTDAAKMQKYYALADAMKALGQMGGAAVGGAIDGNTLDSAPKVDPYKESRGYLDAFERAKKANDRLRAMDEKEFNLALNKQLRDEERAYKSEQDKIAREYSAAQKELERQWTAEQNRIKMEWQAAVADKDFERQAALKKELAEAERKFKFEYQKIENEQRTKEKNISKEIVNIQNGIAKNPVPIGFKNGKGITIPKAYYEDMQDFFIGDDWNGRRVTKENVKEFIKNNPEKVNAYLEMYGMGFLDKAKPTVSSQSKDSKNWFDPMMVSYNRHAEPEPNATNGQPSANAETKDGQSTVISDEEFVKKWGNNSI